MGKQRKKFWDDRSKKLHKKKRQHKRNYSVHRDKTSKEKKKSYRYTPDYTFVVPTCFSLINNLDETALFLKI